MNLVWMLLAAKIISDRDSGRSRGFGFVTYSTPEEANSAIQAFDQKACFSFVIVFFLAPKFASIIGNRKVLNTRMTSVFQWILLWIITQHS